MAADDVLLKPYEYVRTQVLDGLAEVGRIALLIGETFRTMGRGLQAFDLIVERHRRAVYQICYRFMGNHEDASDLSQDVFLRAYRGLKNFKGNAALGTWLHRIAVNTCLNRVALKTPKSEPLRSARGRDDHVRKRTCRASGKRARPRISWLESDRGRQRMSATRRRRRVLGA